MASIGQSSSPSPGSSTGSQSTTTEYVVRAPNASAKKHSMIKFSSGTNIDFLKLTNTTVKMERQNNLKEYKSIYNVDTMPKFGAGSEYGREQKEEARRKKFGINIKRYNPEAQPWLMKVGKGKDAKRFKGGREGTITENTSYYIFTQCADGAFDAYPVEEWYNFQPIVNYKFLNSEEAEEEFSRRDKTMNLFSIMVKKRIRNEDDGGEPDEPEKKEKKKTTKKDSNLILTDMDDWGAMSDEEEADEDNEGDEDSKPKKKEKKKGGGKQKRKKNSKHNDNNEAVEESDEGDFDDRELDYITDSGSDSGLDNKEKEEKYYDKCVDQEKGMVKAGDSGLDDKEKEDKYDDKGVDQEKGLKKLIDSEEDSSDEEEEKKEEEEAEEEAAAEEKKEKGKKKKKEAKEGGDDSDSSSSSSESDDSDIEKNEEKFSSVLFMQKKKGESRSATPTIEKSADSAKSDGKEAVKRKVDIEDSPEQTKKMRTESPVSSSANLAALSGEITEEAIRRYLMRKPMTAKDLVQKFRSKKPQMSKELMTQKIGQLLKKINPERKYVNNVLYLSVKKTE